MKQILAITLALSAVGAVARSPYAAEVYEYRPAPGQFVNTRPAYTDGDTEADMCRKALASIGGVSAEAVTLGSFGGYITLGFDHTVENVAGQPDFVVLGNAFFDSKALKGEGGSCEPGVVMVSRDVNGNGKPDDPWYEILGTATGTTASYTVTYHRPADGHSPVVSDPAGAYDDDEYIGWTASDGTSGHMPHLIVNPQPYYPQWVSGPTITLSGRRLPDNAVQEQHGRFKEWVAYPVGEGYADCWPNDDSRAGIDIGRAVDADGHAANLPGIDFVRVYTGVHQQAGALGEISTEVCGMVDLHLAAGIDEPGADVAPVAFFAGDELRVLGLASGARVDVYDMSGCLRVSATARGGADSFAAPLPSGVYILRVGTATLKAVK